MKKILSLLFVFVSLTASAQQTASNTFSTPDLRAFELKGHVKSIQWTGPTMEEMDENKLGTVEFSVAGHVTYCDFELTRDDNTDYITEIEGLEVAEAREEADGEFSVYEWFGTLGAPIYFLEWKGDVVSRVCLSTGSAYVMYGLMGPDGNMKTTKCTGGNMASFDGSVGKTWPVKYYTYDAYGNWTRREGDYRKIEYYTFEEDFERFKQGDGTLDEIADIIETFEEAELYEKKVEAEELWNQRALIFIDRSRNINEDVNKILNSEYASEDTRTAAIEKWNSVYFAKLNAEKEPTAIVNEIMNSPLASDGLKITSQGYWNEFYKEKVDKATNPTEYASTIIDNPLMLEDYRQHILALVHNYELQHNVEGITDYNALYKEANVKCGSYNVFSADERKKINYNADQYKRQTTNRFIVRSQDLMKEERLTESREEVLKALAIEPDYKSAIEQRAEVEYRILWKQILTFEATVSTVDAYFKANPSSKYSDTLTTVRYLLEHLNHKDSGPTKLYKKMVKKGEVPELEKVMKAVQKCQKKDIK